MNTRNSEHKRKEQGKKEAVCMAQLPQFWKSFVASPHILLQVLIKTSLCSMD
jgi:hypothetical protein